VPTQEPPLAGVRVIDVGTRISAPFCAGLLGEMGADVIKIEDPRGGDFMRGVGPFLRTEDGSDYSLWWAVEGRGRRGVTLDLRSPSGQDLFRRLTASADVVCENFRPGTLESWGIAPGDCDPSLVWARISVFGQDGPYSDRPGLDRMGIAYGGLLNLTGFPDRPPVRPGVTISDYLTGAFAAQAVLAALYARDRSTGRTGQEGGAASGAVIDAPLYGAILRVMEWTLAGQDVLGVTRGRQGNRLSTSAPVDNYPTSDGKYISIVGGSDANFARLCHAMGRPDLASDPEWDTLAKRARRSDVINDVVAGWTSSLPAEEIERICIDLGVPVATALDAKEILNNNHMQERGDFVTIDDSVAGPHLQQAPFPRFNGTAPPTPSSAPLLGEHNREVWCDLVGLTPNEFETLTDEGVI
jgi:crotonobetainyl-CoA:carnitine CoA-transferase CaiB-like acyl-CoA transferase